MLLRTVINPAFWLGLNYDYIIVNVFFSFIFNNKITCPQKSALYANKILRYILGTAFERK